MQPFYTLRRRLSRRSTFHVLDAILELADMLLKLDDPLCLKTPFVAKSGVLDFDLVNALIRWTGVHAGLPTPPPAHLEL